MRSAAVGHQCPDCVGEGARTVRPARTAFGARPGRSATPVVTYTLIGVNVLMFLLQSTSAGLERELVLWPPAVADGELYRLLTSAFLHYGLTHILFNMWWFLSLAGMMEQILGKRYILTFVLLTAFASTFAEYLFNTPFSVGMSGVVYGLFGYIWMKGKFDPGDGLMLHPTTIMIMLFWFGFCFFLRCWSFCVLS